MKLKGYKQIKMINYRRLKSFTSSRTAIAIAFFWGLSEATFFFIVPDVFFAFTALFIPTLGLIHGIVTIFGSMVGGIIMYKLASIYPLALQNFLNQIPGINEHMITQVYTNFNTMGLKALFIAPLSGVPYKIYGVEAAIAKIDFAQFILMTFPSRLIRILAVSLIASGVGKIFQKNIEQHTKRWVVFYITLWIIIYVLYVNLINYRY